MANPLREVIARFTTAVDTSALDSLDKKIQKLSMNYGALAFGAAAAFAGATAATVQFIQKASGVAETQNKIEALFGKDTRNEIIAWSKTVEQQMGRSEFAFQETFGNFAAFLDPLGLGTEKVTQMSKALAMLKVDLASFYDTSEEDAAMRLFSGMAGETEAVRRLGIDISDTALANLYNSNQNPLDPQHRAGMGAKGVNRGKGIAAMTLQQKAVLRFTKIMMDTRKAQGDAERTSGGWANTLKRLTDRVDRLGIALGRVFMKTGTGVLNVLEKIVHTTEQLVTRSKGVELAFISLAALAAAYASAWVAANAAVLASFGPLLLAFAEITAAFLIVEDIWTFFSDANAETGFGKLVTALTGIDRPLYVIQDRFARIQDNVAELYNTLIKFSGLQDLFGLESADTNHENRSKDERKIRRNEALASGDIGAFLDARESGQTEEEGRKEFMRRRGVGVATGYFDAMPADMNNEYYREANARVVPAAESGGDTWTIEVNNTIHATKDIDVQEAVARGLQEAIAAGRAKVDRRGIPGAAGARK